MNLQTIKGVLAAVVEFEQDDPKKTGRELRPNATNSSGAGITGKGAKG